MHSNLFKKLFQVPQRNNEPLIEGCQIVQLFGGSAQDMEHVLSLLYYCFMWHDLQTNFPFSTVAAIIRLGRKYEFTRLQAIALRRLQTLFPKALIADWLRGNSQFTAEFLFDVVNLAKDNSINSILPAAYLQVCMTCSLDTIFNGIQRKNGDHLKLNHQSMMSCILCREKLASQLPKSIFPSLLREPSLSDSLMDLPPHDRCSKHSCCASSTRATRAAFLGNLEGSGMKFLQKPEAINELAVGFFNECHRLLANDYIIGRKYIWDQLPNWGELKDF